MGDRGPGEGCNGIKLDDYVNSNPCALSKKSKLNNCDNGCGEITSLKVEGIIECNNVDKFCPYSKNCVGGSCIETSKLSSECHPSFKPCLTGFICNGTATEGYHCIIPHLLRFGDWCGHPEACASGLACLQDLREFKCSVMLQLYEKMRWFYSLSALFKYLSWPMWVISIFSYLFVWWRCSRINKRKMQTKFI